MTIWLHWLAALLIILGILMVGIGIIEWWEWRRDLPK